MSQRHQEYLSLWKTRKLLGDISSGRVASLTDIRILARECLKHYPFLLETGAPRFSTDGFDCPPIVPDTSKMPLSELMDGPDEMCGCNNK